MEYIDILIEAAGDNHLYHATNADAAEAILYGNVVEARTVHSSTTLVSHKGWNKRVDHGFRLGEIDQHGKIYGVSMSRSVQYPNYLSGDWGVVLVFDRNTIRHSNRIVPIAYYGRGVGRRDEMEDFVVGDLKNMNRSLVGIQITQSSYDALVTENEIFEPDHQPHSLLLNHPLLRIIP